MSGNQHCHYRARHTWPMLVCIVLASLLLSGCSLSQPRVYRVGVLSGLRFFDEAIDGFKSRMTELGYIEGQNIHYDIQHTDVDPVAYARVLDQFVADEVDLIFVFPTEAALAAKTATQDTDIPVVFAFAWVDSVDLIESVNEPGGNITGVRFPGPDVALKRFEIMREFVPQARRIWIPYRRDYPTVATQLAVLQPAAASADVTLIELPATNADELAAIFQERASATDSRPDAILLLAEPLAKTPAAFLVIARFAAEQQIPVGGSHMTMEGYESIFGVDVNNVVAGKQAAGLADKIFSGTPAGSIPVVAAETLLLIDYTATQQLGVVVPEGLLYQADEVFR